VSRKLHLRAVRRTFPFPLGLAAECALAGCGAVLLAIALRWNSNSAAAIGAISLTVALEPLVKVAAGLLLGIRYDYAYLLGLEPRFKMRYGTYLVRARPARIVFHFAGMIGSPLGAWLSTRFLGPELATARRFCWVLFAFAIAINAAIFGLALAGVRRIGPLRLSLASAAVAATELREALQD